MENLSPEVEVYLKPMIARMNMLEKRVEYLQSTNKQLMQKLAMTKQNNAEHPIEQGLKVEEMKETVENHQKPEDKQQIVPETIHIHQNKNTNSTNNNKQCILSPITEPHINKLNKNQTKIDQKKQEIKKVTTPASGVRKATVNNTNKSQLTQPIQEVKKEVKKGLQHQPKHIKTQTKAQTKPQNKKTTKGPTTPKISNSTSQKTITDKTKAKTAFKIDQQKKIKEEEQPNQIKSQQKQHEESSNNHNEEEKPIKWFQNQKEPKKQNEDNHTEPSLI